MASRKPTAHRYPQAEKKHPEPYERDLNPSRMAGQNIGEHNPEEAPQGCYAGDVKELRRILADFSREELQEILVLGPGARVQQGKTYLDIHDGHREMITATGNISVEPGHWYVPKPDTPYPYWNRLLGMRDPKRTT